MTFISFEGIDGAGKSTHIDALANRFTARRDHIQHVIAPALASGDVVLCDRFADASFAYQGAGRGLDWGILLDLERWVQEGLQPDLTIWFDLPADIAAQRFARINANQTPENVWRDVDAAMKAKVFL